MLGAVGGGMVLLSAVLTYAMTRRYGWKTALTLPVLAVLALLAMRWQALGLGFRDSLDEILPNLLFSAPVLLGAVAGVAVARLRRG